ncbi:MAG: hypothetical protein D6794_05460, partial [Deltaproteobacteria bacterium]
DVGRIPLLTAIAVALLVTLIIFLAGRPVAGLLGTRGLAALEKLTGMLLSVIAVNMVLVGLHAFLSGSLR